MNTLILLNEADHSCLDSIIHRNAPPPYPDPEQTVRLRDLLSSARHPAAGEDLLTHVELGDLVTPVSPLDSVRPAAEFSSPPGRLTPPP